MNCCQAQRRVEKVYSCSHNHEIQDICSKFQSSTISLSDLRSNLTVAEYTKILESILSRSMEKTYPCPMVEENEIYVKFCDSDETLIGDDASMLEEEVVYSLENLEYESSASVVQKPTEILLDSSAIDKMQNLQLELLKIQSESQNARTRSTQDELHPENDKEKSANLKSNSTSSVLKRGSQMIVKYVKSSNFVNAALLVLTLSLVTVYSINKFIH